MKKTATLLLLGLFLLPAIAFAQEKDSLQQQIEKAVTGKAFTIEVNQATPQRGGLKTLTPDYEFSVRGDSAISYLPYFGVSHQAAYGDTEGGIKFRAPMNNYKVQFNEKKREYNISFSVKGPKDNYNIRLNIFLNGTTYINITPGQSDNISYSGTMLFQATQK